MRFLISAGGMIVMLCNVLLFVFCIINAFLIDFEFFDEVFNCHYSSSHVTPLDIKTLLS